MSVIKVENLTWEQAGKVILDNISFSLANHETLVLLGTNGCGKTSLLKAIVGLIAISSGDSHVLGVSMHHGNKFEQQNCFKQIGYVFQKSGLFDFMTVKENILFFLRRFTQTNNKDMEKKVQYCLSATNLQDVENLLPAQLSGGMQKRVCIARSIIADPRLFLMDSPTAGLDPVLTDSIGNLILDLKKRLQASFIITTYNLTLTYKLADRIGLMHNGQLCGILTKEEFRTTQEKTFVQFREAQLDGPISIM